MGMFSETVDFSQIADLPLKTAPEWGMHGSRTRNQPADAKQSNYRCYPQPHNHETTVSLSSVLKKPRIQIKGHSAIRTGTQVL